MPSEPVTRLELEQLALGELPVERVRAIESAAAGDPELASRIGCVRTEIDAAARDLPPLRLPSPAPAWARWPPLVVAGLALAAALLLWLRPGPSETFRGGFDLKVERLRNGRVAEVGLVIDVREGDRIQYVVTPQRDGTLGVFDLQDDGELFTWLAPREVAAFERVTGAAELDDYTGSERMFVVFHPDGFTTAELEEALERVWRTPLLALDALPIDADQRSVVLLRGETP